jgi:hypothetical protein
MVMLSFYKLLKGAWHSQIWKYKSDNYRSNHGVLRCEFVCALGANGRSPKLPSKQNKSTHAKTTHTLKHFWIKIDLTISQGSSITYLFLPLIETIVRKEQQGERARGILFSTHSHGAGGPGGFTSGA